MTEQEARLFETKIKWNGKANVCSHCGNVPKTFYVVTGHDHTDYDIKWCPCRTTYNQAVKGLLANPTKLRTELEGTRSVIIQHAIGMLNQIGLSGAEADEIVKRGGS